jgi:hypothetical protein
LPCSIVADFFEPNLQFCVSKWRWLRGRDRSHRSWRAQQPDRMRLIGMLMGFAESDPAILDVGADQHV